MSFFSLLAGKVINATADGIVAVALHVPFLMHALMSIPYTPPQQVAPVVHSTSTTTANSTIRPTKSLPVETASIILVSSTTQVGDFTVVVTCDDSNPNSIAVLKNGVVVQTIPIKNGIAVVPDACREVKAQDVNFDGYPDLMLDVGAGSGGTSVAYWLYSSTTGQFSCNEPYGICGFMNPHFDPSTKTITSEGQMGAGSIDIQIYQAVNGKLVQVKEYNGSDEGAIKEGFTIGY